MKAVDREEYARKENRLKVVEVDEVDEVVEVDEVDEVVEVDEFDEVDEERICEEKKQVEGRTSGR